MKTQLLGVLFVGITFLFVLQSASGGRAASGGQDRTGAPGALGTCTACHANNGSFSNPQIGIVVKDGSGNTVTSYVPGDTYTLEFNVTSGGTPNGYAMQAVILDAANANVGDLLTTTTANTQLSTIGNGREFVEHQGVNGTGAFIATWEAPVTGTGTVTIYGIGMAVNGTGGTPGDNTSPTTQVALTESPASSIVPLHGDESSFDIYPVPNNGSFNITNRGEVGPVNLQIFTLEGRAVYEENVLNLIGTHSIYCKDLVPGIYIVKIQGENSRQTQRMIIQ